MKPKVAGSLEGESPLSWLQPGLPVLTPPVLLPQVQLAPDKDISVHLSIVTCKLSSVGQ